MEPTHTFVISADDAGQRLDQFLTTQLPDLTRSQIQKFITKGAAQRNGQQATKHVKIKEGDTVTINTALDITPPAVVKTIEDSTHLVPTILAETDDYIVIEKPSGLLVHPTDHDEPYTLMHWLVKKYPKVASVGESHRAGIVHRLDKEVSGVMVLCKTQQMFLHLKAQFKNRKVKKKYMALVHGVIDEVEGDIDFPIARSASQGKMAARPQSQGGKDALTQYNVVKRFNHHTIVHAFPKTGRTHQIRVHFFALGFPIVGDPLYVQKKFATDKIGKAATRIFLHSTELTFTDLDGEQQMFVSALPEELETTLNTL